MANINSLRKVDAALGGAERPALRRADRAIGLGAAALVAAGGGLLAGWLMPRGPATTAGALAAMVGALVVGFASGLLARSRWTLLLAPVLFTLAIELARAGVVGPTVDRLYLGSTYGIIAFVVGRVLPGLLLLLPLVLGAAYGVGLAGRLVRGPATGWGILGWGVIGLLTLATFALAVIIARPATTAPVIGANGEPVPGAIAELATVRIGGHDQVMLIRGRSVENPILLHLAGGPGGTDLGAMRADVSLEQNFVVATWDQRGTGKSYAALDPVATLTLEQMVADTLEVTDYLRNRFGQDKIYLMANSWGTLLGVLAAQQRPELYHAYIGTGQMVNPRATDVMFYADALAWAERTGNSGLATTLRRNGLPPYEDILHYEPAVGYEHDWNPYPELDGHKELPFNLFVPENTVLDQINGMRGFLDTFSILYPQLQDIDFQRDALRLEIPVYVVLGEHEARGRAVLAREWFAKLEAPHKELVVFEHSGHRPSFEEPGRFAELMAGIAAGQPATQ